MQVLGWGVLHLLSGGGSYHGHGRTRYAGLLRRGQMGCSHTHVPRMQCHACSVQRTCLPSCWQQQVSMLPGSFSKSYWAKYN